MAFVKLDCAILNSSLWGQRSEREIFITSLLMAEPWELEAPHPQIEVESLRETGWIVPAGWYGFVHAAGRGIINRSGMDLLAGMAALTALCSPDVESRDPAHGGRRMARVSGGYVILNYMRYRERDLTAAERQRKYRAKLAAAKLALRCDVTSQSRNITDGDVDVDVDVDVDGESPCASTNPVPTTSGGAGHPVAGKPRKPKPNGIHETHARSALFILNEASGRQFRETDANLTLISSRLREPGVDIDGVRMMIERQCARWKADPKMCEYLRPETLFNKSKFDSYYAARTLPIQHEHSKPHRNDNIGTPESRAAWQKQVDDLIAQQARAVAEGTDENLFA